MALDAELEAVQRELEELGCAVDDDELAELDSTDLAELEDLDDEEIAGLEQQLRDAEKARDEVGEESCEEGGEADAAASQEDEDKDSRKQAVQNAFEAEMADLEDRYEGSALLRELQERLLEKTFENDELVEIVDYIKQKYVALKNAGGTEGGGGAEESAELEDLRDALDDQEQENINLDRILQQLQAAHLELKKTYETVKESSLSAEAAHQHQLQEMERSISQCTERFLGMKKELDDNQQKLDLENRTVCEELALSKKKNQEIELEVERLLDEKVALEKEVQDTASRVEAAKESESGTREHLRKEIATLEEQVEKHLGIEETQKNLINQLESDISSLKKQNAALQSSSDEAERLARKQEREIARLNNQMQRLEEEKARLHKEKREAERQARLR